MRRKTGYQTEHERKVNHIQKGKTHMRLFDVYSRINDCFIGWTYAETAAKAVNNVRFRVYGKMESNRNFYAVKRK